MNRSLARKQRQLDLNRHLGAFLARLRREQHLKQADVAERMDVRRPLVSKIENGYRSLDAMEISDYANALGLPAQKLFDGIYQIVVEYDDNPRR